MNGKTLGEKSHIISSRNTQMTSKVFDKFYSLIFLLFPKLHVSILAGCDNEVGPAKVNCLSVKLISCVSEEKHQCCML